MRPSPRPTRTDVALAVALVVVGAVSILSGDPPRWQFPLEDPAPLVPAWVPVLLVVASLAAVLLKRRWMYAALVIASVTALLNTMVGVMLVSWIALCDVLYLVGERSSRRGRVVGTVVCCVVIMGFGIFTLAVTGDLENAIGGMLALFAALVVPFWWGVSVQQERAIANLADERATLSTALAERAVRDSAAERAEPVARERAAVARDLHDVVSARLSAIALHSAAALAEAPDTERDRRALEDVRAASVASISEMRELIEVLRSGEDRLDATNGMREGRDGPLLDPGELAAWAVGAGLTVDLRVDESALGSLPAPFARELAPVAREALVNALKYGTDRVRIAFDGSSDAVRLCIENSIDADAARLPTGGAGLASMRERVSAIGGSIASGPVPVDDDETDASSGTTGDGPGAASPEAAVARTWRVDVRVPIRAAAER